MSREIDAPVLVLNQNYEPLNVCNVKRALVLVFNGKAEVLELNHAMIHTPSHTLHAPSVIRLAHLIRRPHPRAKLSRREVFLRDDFMCQYCGQRTRDLTLDHVIPKSRGGPHTWDNLVSACRACNHRKGGKSVEEARMRPLRAPRQPKANIYHLVYRYVQQAPLEEWHKFLPGLSS